MHLDDEVLRVLQAAGVVDAVLARSRPMAGLRLLDGRHRVLAEFRRSPDAGPHGLPQGSFVHQPDLEEVLAAAAEADPRITVERGVEVVGVAPDEPVVVTLRGRDDGADRSVRAAAVLGCDGANSTVRGLIGATMRELGPPDRWLVLDVRATEPLPVWPGVHQVCDPGRAATFMPVTADRYRWECRMAPGETVADLTTPDGAGPAARAGRPGGRHGRARRRVHLPGRRWPTAGGGGGCSWPATRPTSARRSSGRGWAWGCATCTSWPGSSPTSSVASRATTCSTRYQAEREPHARALIGVARLLGRLMTGGGRAGSVLRRAVLAVVRRIPVVARLATDSRSPALPAGPLVERRGRAGRRLAGHLVPQPTVVAGQPCRLDDVLGPGETEIRLDGDRLVVRRADGSEMTVDDPSGVLLRWLEHGRASAVRVRPDRIVRSARP